MNGVDYSTDDIAGFMKGNSLSEVERWKFFIKTFFAFIEEIAVKDKEIEISGLGTFKLQKVRSLQVFDDKTGEVSIIPPHYRMVFMADNALNDKVGDLFNEIAEERAKEQERLALEEAERKKAEEELRKKINVEENVETPSSPAVETIETPSTEVKEEVHENVEITIPVEENVGSVASEGEKNDAVVIETKVEEQTLPPTSSAEFIDVTGRSYGKKKRYAGGRRNTSSASGNRIHLTEGSSGIGIPLSGEKRRFMSLKVLFFILLLVVILGLGGFFWVKNRNSSMENDINKRPQFENLDPVNNDEMEVQQEGNM